MTEEEATEALQVAMTVGATRMQVMLNAEQAKLGAPQESPTPAATSNAQPESVPPEPIPPVEGAAASPVESETPATSAPATFTAAEVVPQAGGG